MLMLVSYDVSTVNAAGRRRLHRVAKVCENWGIRVQNSVFECHVDSSQWGVLKSQLLSICELATDSLRFYNLGNNYTGKTEHYGARETVDPKTDTLIV